MKDGDAGEMTLALVVLVGALIGMTYWFTRDPMFVLGAVGLWLGATVVSKLLWR